MELNMIWIPAILSNLIVVVIARPDKEVLISVPTTHQFKDDVLANTDKTNNDDIYPRTREKLEKEYLDHFGRKSGNGSPVLVPWNALHKLQSPKKGALRKLCLVAYKASHQSDITKDDITLSILSHRSNIPVLLVGPPKPSSQESRAEILECTIKKVLAYPMRGKFPGKISSIEVIYLAKGRRPNSVYFIKPTLMRNNNVPDNFVLDESFSGDVDLPYDFSEEALSLSRQRWPDKESTQVLGNPG